VGIGTTSPSRTLHVLGQTGIGTVLKLEGASGTTTYLQLAYNGATNAQSGYIGYDTSANMSLFTNDTERMRITSSGNVGIGTTSPSERLTVSGNGTFSGSLTTAGLLVTNNRLWISANNPISDWISSSLTAGYSATNSYGWLNSAGSLILGTNGADRLNISSSGAATFSNSVTATAFFASSDIRLKDIISHDGDMITYKWKDGRDDKIHYGYSAQNLQSINPNLVNKNDDGFLSVNYTETLVLKVRELEKEVQLLKAQIN
jgi:hypothetical protein